MKELVILALHVQAHNGRNQQKRDRWAICEQARQPKEATSRAVSERVEFSLLFDGLSRWEQDGPFPCAGKKAAQ